MPAIFFTGFPGFLGSELLPRVLMRAPDAEAICLVQPRFMEIARARAEALMTSHPSLRGRFRCIPGDITQPDLGFQPAAELCRRVTEIHHLAAIYDLGVARELAMRVNAHGTRHVLAFGRQCPNLARFHYASTCYVSGRYAGVFTEDQLEEGQTFNNFYEESKYRAEIEVRRAMQAGLPATVYRPAIVVGNSHTGATQKYDGLYFGIRWLLRQPRWAVMPVIGDPSRTEFNVVPCDFVVAAVDYLGARPESAGKVYNLADPSPLTMDAMFVELGRATGRRIFRLHLSLRAARTATERIPGVYRLTGIPASVLDYIAHPTRYSTVQTQAALEGSGVRCPRVPQYIDRLVRFAREHPDIRSAAMA